MFTAENKVEQIYLEDQNVLWISSVTRPVQITMLLGRGELWCPESIYKLDRGLKIMIKIEKQKKLKNHNWNWRQICRGIK